MAPMMGATYGGLGARVRVRQHDDPNDAQHGLAVTGQVAGEYRSHQLIEEGSDHQQGVPDNGVMAAGSLAVGYDWRHFGLHAGAALRSVYGPPSIPCDASTATADCLTRATYPTRDVAVFPDVTLSARFTGGLHTELGVGAYTPAMLLRPGAHVGIGYATPSGADVTARCGLQNVTTDSNAVRCDLSGALPVSDRVSLGLGGAVVPGDARVDFDGRATLSVRIGP